MAFGPLLLQDPEECKSSGQYDCYGPRGFLQIHMASTEYDAGRALSGDRRDFGFGYPGQVFKFFQKDIYNRAITQDNVMNMYRAHGSQNDTLNVLASSDAFLEEGWEMRAGPLVEGQTHDTMYSASNLSGATDVQDLRAVGDKLEFWPDDPDYQPGGPNEGDFYTSQANWVAVQLDPAKFPFDEDAYCTYYVLEFEIRYGGSAPYLSSGLHEFNNDPTGVSDQKRAAHSEYGHFNIQNRGGAYNDSADNINEIPSTPGQWIKCKSIHSFGLSRSNDEYLHFGLNDGSYSYTNYYRGVAEDYIEVRNIKVYRPRKRGVPVDEFRTEVNYVFGQINPDDDLDTVYTKTFELSFGDINSATAPDYNYIGEFGPVEKYDGIFQGAATYDQYQEIYTGVNLSRLPSVNVANINPGSQTRTIQFSEQGVDLVMMGEALFWVDLGVGSVDSPRPPQTTIINHWDNVGAYVAPTYAHNLDPQWALDYFSTHQESDGETGPESTWRYQDHYANPGGDNLHRLIFPDPRRPGYGWGVSHQRPPDCETASTTPSASGYEWVKTENKDFKIQQKVVYGPISTVDLTLHTHANHETNDHTSDVYRTLIVTEGTVVGDFFKDVKVPWFIQSDWHPILDVISYGLSINWYGLGTNFWHDSLYARQNITPTSFHGATHDDGMVACWMECDYRYQEEDTGYPGEWNEELAPYDPPQGAVVIKEDISVYMINGTVEELDEGTRGTYMIAAHPATENPESDVVGYSGIRWWRWVLRASGWTLEGIDDTFTVIWKLETFDTDATHLGHKPLGSSDSHVFFYAWDVNTFKHYGVALSGDNGWEYDYITSYYVYPEGFDVPLQAGDRGEFLGFPTEYKIKGTTHNNDKRDLNGDYINNEDHNWLPQTWKINGVLVPQGPHPPDP